MYIDVCTLGVYAFTHVCVIRMCAVLCARVVIQPSYEIIGMGAVAD